MQKPNNTEILNAVIETASIGTYDFGYMSFIIGIKHEKGHQGFGTYDLRFFGIEILERIMNVVGVSEWNDLIGKCIRIKREDRMIVDIGDLLSDNWVDMENLKRRAEIRNRNEEMEMNYE